MRQLVLAHWDFLNRLARQRFPDTNLADEALLFVLAALEAADWQKIRAFQGKASFATFLSHVTWSLLEDFSRHKFGRPRPPMWVKARGSLWEKVYRLLCLERRTAMDVIESLTSSGQFGRSREMVAEAVEMILSRIPDCGRRTDEIEPQEGAESGEFSPFHLSPEAWHMARQRMSLIQSLGGYLTGAGGTPNSTPPGNNLQNLLEKLRANIELNAEERLFLKLVFQEGLAVSTAGRLLGYNTAQAHRCLRRLLGRIRAAFEKAGIDQELKTCLD